MLLPFRVLKLIYNALINSKMNYYVEAWSNAANIHLHQILVHQKKILCIMYKKPTFSPSQVLFIWSSILPVESLYMFWILIQAHTFYSFSSRSTHDYNTSSSLINLQLPFSKSAAGHRRILYQCSSLWNALPVSLRSITSRVGFRVNLRLHLLADC